MANKIIDINARSGGRAGLDNFDKFSEFYQKKFVPLRTPKIDVKRLFSPASIDAIPEFIVNTYKIDGLEFGNWVNQYRRLDFCLNMVVALFDLQKVLQFPNNNLGINKSLNIAFGARGASRAYAHYEPASKVINLSRDRRVDKLAVNLFGNKIAPYDKDKDLYLAYAKQFREDASGYGSFAHEYGHFLDYICGEKYTKYNVALSGGAKNLASYNNKNKARLAFDYATLRPIRNEIQETFLIAFESFLFTGKDYDNPSGFYRRVYDYADKRGEYWSRLNEIWARIFETYIAYKLKKVGIVDKVLIRDGKGKYRNELGNAARNVYPTFGEMEKNVKKIDAFINSIKKKI
jgi:hypothetical protein